MADKKNYFLYKRQYPDTLGILNGEQINMPEFCKKSVFVFDTNSLLVPYKVGKESLNEITRIYQSFSGSDRIFVAAHSLREFAKHRSDKISELFTEVDKTLSALPAIKDFNYPILSEMDAYKELITYKPQVATAVKLYKEKLQSLQKGINEWNWFDPVTQLYQGIFKTENILETTEDEEILNTEFDNRMLDDIPPGNKDATKSENAIGDFLIWKCILELGKSKKTDIVFVSNDEKNDWMVKGNKKSISTRFELVDEFSRYTTGQKFTCLNFADFLEIHGALKEVVSEVETAAETTVSSNPKFIRQLNEIFVIIKRFMNDDESDGEDQFIKDAAIDGFINEFSNSWEEEVGKSGAWVTLKNDFYSLEDTLFKIKKLNGEIHYQSVRMKRSTYDQQIDLKKQCHVFINQYNSISFLF
jgi:hypothetical protein